MPWTGDYDSSKQTLISRVTGILAQEEVVRWRDGLYAAAAQIPPGGEFRALMDIRGYEVSEQERAVHTAMREVIPIFLAEHGFVVGFWRLYDATPPPAVSTSRCRAVAHVHHDVEKAERYNELLSTATERFFTDRDAAQAWLETT